MADERDLQEAFARWMNAESQDMHNDQHRRDIFEAGWDAHAAHIRAETP